MNKIHNPITRKVEEIRNIWVQAREKNPDKTLIRVLMKPDDIELFHGFLKWESSEQGVLPELFIVLFTPFESLDTFSFQLAKDFVAMYRIEAEKDERFTWNYVDFEQQLNTLTDQSNAQGLLIQILESYKAHLDNQAQDLIIGIIPQYIKDMPAYNAWLHNILQYELSKGIQWMILDHTDQEYMTKVCEKDREKAMTIHIKDMNMKAAIEAVATAGNPHDPQVQIRKCMIEMGKCLPNHKTKLHEWGEKLLKASQRAADPATFASGHLIYAGYVMHFRDEKKAGELIDQGLAIVKKYLKNDEKCLPVYIQLLGYKAANLTMNGKHHKAVDHFVEQAHAAIQHSLKPIAISAYKTAIYLSDEHHHPKYELILFEAYAFGKGMKDAELATTEYSYIAYHFMKQNQLGTKEDRTELNQRMTELYGKDWFENMKTLLSNANYKRKESRFNLMDTTTAH